MVTDLEVKINGDTVDAISASIQPRSLNQGHKTFTVVLDNIGNKYGGLYHSNDPVLIYVNDILIFRGIVDSIKHLLDYKSKWDWMDYLRVSGRDRSFPLAGYKHTETFPASDTLKGIIDEALSDTGCDTYLETASYETSFPTVGGHCIQDGYLLDLVRDLLAKANWYGDVQYDSGSSPYYFIYLYPMDSEDLETGLTLTDVLGIPNLIEEDGLEIRNYIEVLGAAILCEPADKDEWTESLTGWTNVNGISLSTDFKIIGDYGIRAQAINDNGGSYVLLKFAKNFNLLYGQNSTLKFTATRRRDLVDISKVRLYGGDGDGYFEADFNSGSVDEWAFNSLSLGPNMEVSAANPDGIWTKVGSGANEPDWFNLTAIGFYVHWTVNTSGQINCLIIDGMFLEPVRPRGFAENSTSQTDYGKRETTMINDELTTAAQCQAEADSQLEKLKDPATFIPHLICRGDDFINGSEFLALPARFVTLDLGILAGKYRMENIVISVAPYQDLNNGYDFIVEFDGVPETVKVDADRLEKVTKGRVLPIIKRLAQLARK